MSDLTDFNQCLAWLTQSTTPAAAPDGLILCGNGLPATAITAAQLAQQAQLPTVIIAGGVGHATKYLRRNLGVTNQLSEAAMMLDLMREAGYQGELHLDQTSTNTGLNASHARKLAPQSWHHVLLVQDPLLARRTQLTFERVWGPTVQFSRYQPTTLELTQLDPLMFQIPTWNQHAWPTDYFTELLLGEFQRLIDTADGYGPAGQNFFDHVDVPAPVIAAVQRLRDQHLNRTR